MKIHQPGELIEDANEALQMLKDGNERYLKGEFIRKFNYADDREVFTRCQKPFTAILTCSDSRVAPEIIFDQKLGDIFIIRNAGNIASRTALGSLEYAIKHLTIKLIVVCGHSNCGAIEAVCNSFSEEHPKNVKHIMKHLKPAVKRGGDKDKIIHNNIEIMVEKIKTDEFIKQTDVMIVGAYYDIYSGAVKWL